MEAVRVTKPARAACGDVETAPLLGSVEIQPQDDVDLVNWDGPEDLENPQNWTSRKKWTNLTLLSFMTFLT